MSAGAAAILGVWAFAAVALGAGARSSEFAKWIALVIACIVTACAL